MELGLAAQGTQEYALGDVGLAGLTGAPVMRPEQKEEKTPHSIMRSRGFNDMSVDNRVIELNDKHFGPAAIHSETGLERNVIGSILHAINICKPERRR